MIILFQLVATDNYYALCGMYITVEWGLNCVDRFN